MSRPSARLTLLGFCLTLALGCGGDDSPKLTPVDISTLPPVDASKTKPKVGVTAAGNKIGSRVHD